MSPYVGSQFGAQLLPYDLPFVPYICGIEENYAAMQKVHPCYRNGSPYKSGNPILYHIYTLLNTK